MCSIYLGQLSRYYHRHVNHRRGDIGIHYISTIAVDLALLWIYHQLAWQQIY